MGRSTTAVSLLPMKNLLKRPGWRLVAAGAAIPLTLGLAGAASAAGSTRSHFRPPSIKHVWYIDLENRGSPQTVETSVVVIMARTGWAWCARAWPGQAQACPLFLFRGAAGVPRGQGRPAGPSRASAMRSTLEAGVAAPYP